MTTTVDRSDFDLDDDEATPEAWSFESTTGVARHYPEIGEGGRRCDVLVSPGTLDSSRCNLLWEEHFKYDERGLMLPFPDDTCDACKSERIAPAPAAFASSDDGDWWLCASHYADHVVAGCAYRPGRVSAADHRAAGGCEYCLAAGRDLRGAL